MSFLDLPVLPDNKFGHFVILIDNLFSMLNNFSCISTMPKYMKLLFSPLAGRIEGER